MDDKMQWELNADLGEAGREKKRNSAPMRMQEIHRHAAKVEPHRPIRE